MDDQVFSKNMLVLARVFNEPTETAVWQQKLEIYWRVFKHWGDEQFDTAVLRHVQSGHWFPKPAELRELGIKPGLTAEEAWGEVMRFEGYSHPLIRKAARVIGQDVLNQMTYDQVPTTRAHFFRIFEALQARAEADQYPALEAPNTADVDKSIADRMSF